MKRILQYADLFICTIWLMLLIHEDVSVWTMSPFLLLFPVLRIWIIFLQRRESSLVVLPIVMLMFISLIALLDKNITYSLFVTPLVTLFQLITALVDIQIIKREDVPEFINACVKSALSVGWVAYIWLIGTPLVMYVYQWLMKKLTYTDFNIWKKMGLGTYILIGVIVVSLVVSTTYQTILGILVIILFILLIPPIFNEGNMKGILNRAEVTYLLTLIILIIAYVYGIGFDKKAVMAVGILPAVFYFIVNLHFERKATYKDILLIICASMIFWFAQYTTNMLRILLLLSSLALMAIPVVRFVLATRKRHVAVGIYLIMAFVIPICSIGYNPYTVLEAKRLYHFTQFWGSPNGILCVKDNNGKRGLRDRFGLILPVNEYDKIEVIRNSKPYCKVYRENQYQIFDIVRHELVSEDWFCYEMPNNDGRIYHQLSDGNDTVLVMPIYYDRYAKEQEAMILVHGKKK